MQPMLALYMNRDNIYRVFVPLYHLVTAQAGMLSTPELKYLAFYVNLSNTAPDS
jgi:hypothetical protein